MGIGPIKIIAPPLVPCPRPEIEPKTSRSMPMKIAAVATNNNTLNKENCGKFDVATWALSLALQDEHVQVVGLMQLPQTVRPQD